MGLGMDDKIKLMILNALNSGLRMANPFYVFTEDDKTWQKKSKE